MKKSHHDVNERIMALLFLSAIVIENRLIIEASGGDVILLVFTKRRLTPIGYGNKKW